MWDFLAFIQETLIFLTLFVTLRYCFLFKLNSTVVRAGVCCGPFMLSWDWSWRKWEEQGLLPFNHTRSLWVSPGWPIRHYQMTHQCWWGQNSPNWYTAENSGWHYTASVRSASASFNLGVGGLQECLLALSVFCAPICRWLHSATRSVQWGTYPHIR